MAEDSKFRIELALRAGIIAKSALDITTCSSSGMAKLMLIEVAKNVRELDKFIEKYAEAKRA